jgi:polysaccharide deacetylase 2 family uncharacterized protein YibQ
MINRLRTRERNGYITPIHELRNGRPMRIRIIILSFLLLLAAGGGWYVVHTGFYRTGINRARLLLGYPADALHKKPVRSFLENTIRERLQALEIPALSITSAITGPDSAIEIRSPIPQGKPLECIIWNLSTSTSGTSYSIEDCQCSSEGKKCTIRFISSSSRDRRVILLLHRSSRFMTGSAKMAVIVTDFTFRADNTTVEYLSFQLPLTFALLPSRTLTEQTATISGEYKKEIIIHLPMEPTGFSLGDSRKSLIMVHYPESRLRSIISDAAAAIPSFSGFSNCGGSRVLTDSRVMDIIFSECKKRHVIFIEFPAAKKSLAMSIAAHHGVPIATVDHQIDTTQSSATIKQALLRFGGEARKCGFCIVCSPPNRAFLNALRQAAPELATEGVTFTYVSDLFPERK